MIFFRTSEVLRGKLRIWVLRDIYKSEQAMGFSFKDGILLRGENG